MTTRLFHTAALALIGLLVLPSASAQNRQRGGQRGDRTERMQRHAAEMQTAVGLSDQQMAQIRGVMEAQHADRPERPARDGSRPSEAQRESMRAQMETRRAETHRQIEAVMTPEQVTRFRAFTAEHHHERGERHGERRIESMRESLGLSDRQVEQIQSIAEAQRASRPERPADGARPTAEQRTQMQAQRAEMQRQIEAVLTPAQRTQFEALRAEHHEERGNRRGRRDRRATDR